MSKQYSKGLLIALLLVFFSFSAFSQVPQKINYQAVARDLKSGDEIAGQSILLVAKILNAGPGGSIIYQEEHNNVATNDFGLFQIQIGAGETVQGNFNSIDWASGDFWLEVDLDVGNGLETMGAMQFVAVPYALHAETVSNTDDADADPTNELISNAAFNPEENTITISEGDENIFEIDLSGIQVEDDDPDPANELITSLGLEQDSILVIQDQNTWSVNLGRFIDDDPDPDNELIDADGLTLIDDTILQISEAGILHEVNLADLQDDDDWTRTNTGNVIYNTTDKVGVGTNAPTSTFHTNGSVSAKYRVVLNDMPTTVEVEDTDHYIILQLDDDGESSLTVNMPSAQEVDGRLLVFRRTGDITSVSLEFNFNGDDVNFGSTATPLIVSGFFNQTLRFMSLGADGWVTIDYDN
ncbi:MAG: hypothetical protein ABR574_00205 [Cryomorphaceae bacterium]|nr:hypothetical protein [Flavobacteriales bacterium]